MSDKQLLKLMQEMKRSNKHVKERLTKEEAELMSYLFFKGFKSPYKETPAKK